MWQRKCRARQREMWQKKASKIQTKSKRNGKLIKCKNSSCRVLVQNKYKPKCFASHQRVIVFDVVGAEGVNTFTEKLKSFTLLAWHRRSCLLSWWCRCRQSQPHSHWLRAHFHSIAKNECEPQQQQWEKRRRHARARRKRQHSKIEWTRHYRKA